MTSLKQSLITSEQGMASLCQRLEQADEIAFDTEFVSEHSFRPQLCLLQIATRKELAVVDPLAALDVTPFWKIITGESQRRVVVHAGREEMAFCLEATGRMPQRLLDVQLGAGMVGLEYPAGYGNLIQRYLGKTAPKAETRTDWRRRPLTDRQIAYAVDDVRYLFPIYDALQARLEELGRSAWLEEEMTWWKESLQNNLNGERWRRVSGSSGMPGRSLAIVRELWHWREEEARRRNRPARQILRDDLIVELAKRKTAIPQQIVALRGFERGDLKRALPEISAAISRAIALDEADCPLHVRRDSNGHLTLVGQFLASALGSVCRSQQVAASLVGTADDVRDLVMHRLAQRKGAHPPALTVGWRAQVVGRVLDDLLAGKMVLRIADPAAEEPLAIEPRGLPPG